MCNVCRTLLILDYVYPFRHLYGLCQSDLIKLNLTQLLVGNKLQFLCCVRHSQCSIAHSLNFQTPSKAKTHVGGGYYHFDRDLDGRCGSSDSPCFWKNRCFYELEIF